MLFNKDSLPLLSQKQYLFVPFLLLIFFYLKEVVFVLNEYFLVLKCSVIEAKNYVKKFENSLQNKKVFFIYFQFGHLSL